MPNDLMNGAAPQPNIHGGYGVSGGRGDLVEQGAMWPRGYIAMWPRSHLATWPRGRVAMWPRGYVAALPRDLHSVCSNGLAISLAIA